MKEVALALGRLDHRGSYLSTGEERFHIPARRVPIGDATGAGDSFRTGFLMALLAGQSSLDVMCVARRIVEVKLQTVGPLLQPIDHFSLYDTLLSLPLEER